MGIIMFLVLGLVAGLLARAIMPGRQSMGLLATTVVGMVGSFIGGFVSSLIQAARVASLTPVRMPLGTETYCEAGVPPARESALPERP